MKNAILVHGTPSKEEYYDGRFPSPSNSHWIPWLSKQLQIKDIFAVAVEIPTPWKPDYEVWCKEFERFDINSESTLVGHSCGAGFLTRWLSENKDISVSKVILVAPWVNPENEDRAKYFFNFKFDPDLADRTEGLILFNSSDDMDSVQKSVRIILNNVNNVKLVEFENYGHFTLGDMGTVEFPELLEACLNA